MKSIEIIFCIAIAVVVSSVLIMTSQRPIDVYINQDDIKELCNDAIPYKERKEEKQSNKKEAERKEIQGGKSRHQKEEKG